MFNEQLNNTWIDKLQQFVDHKRVLLLGNSLSLFNQPTGEFIDSFDVVIRVGKGITYKDYTPYIGKKFDIWSFGVLRASIISQVRAPFKIFNYLQVHYYEKSNSLVVPRFMFKEKFQLYRDYFLVGSLQDIDRYTKFFPQDPNIRLSQGIITLLFLLDRIKTYSELHLYGFDFFETQHTFHCDSELKTTHSWHIPKSKAKSDLPHVSDLEKKFIQKLALQGLITLHPVPEGVVDKYVIDKLFSHFRPEATKE